MLKFFTLSLILTASLCSCTKIAADSGRQINGANSVSTSATPTPASTPTLEPDGITEAEMAVLKKRVPQILAWAKFWKLQHQCPDARGGSDKDPKKWNEDYRSKIGQEIEVFVKLENVYQIAVLVPDIKNTMIRFNRINGESLEALDPRLYCADGSSFQQNSVKLAVTVKERNTNIPLDAEQNEMLKQLVKYSNDVACDRRDVKTTTRVRISGPYFEIGDPSILLLIEQPPSEFSNGKSLELLNFYFDHESKKFVASFGKSIGLPSEVMPWVGIFKGHTLRTVNVSCTASASDGE
jgi:hypothetical protein